MKVLLPNGESKYLKEYSNLNKRSKEVEELTERFSLEISMFWEDDRIKYFLDTLANYLVWHKDEDMFGEEDKEVMSIRKIEEMNGERKSKSIPFTYLNSIQREEIGLDDNDYRTKRAEQGV